jgi:radical SAM superfamily enzyme YgiQ (UPF0313 family)
MSQVVILTFLTDPARLVRYPGPYQVAWYVRQHGYSSQVLDFLYFMTKEQRLSLYKKYITSETKIVGWAPFLMGVTQKLYHGLDLSLEILEEIKENFPWVKIIVGGQVVRWFLTSGYKLISFKIDAVFDGEGEYSFLEYCDYVFKQLPHPRFQIQNGLKVIKPSKTYDISSCKMRYEENDFILPGESVGLELSRGCIFKCKFCQYPNIGKNKDDFNRSMDIIRETLIYHYEKFGITRYHLADDTLNSHRERTNQFFEMTKTLPFKIEYVGYVRIDLLDIWPEQLDTLPESGLASCHFGIESLDPESCKLIGKGWGAKNYKTWLPKVKDHWGDRVIINCSLIAGLGKETVTDWENTYKWFLESDIDDYFYQPLHLDYNLMSSEFERNAEKYGYKWPDPIKNPKKWVSDYTDSYQARLWCESKLTEELISKRIPSAWNYVSYRNQGFSREQLLNSNYVQIEKTRIKDRISQKFVNDYYQKAINY